MRGILVLVVLALLPACGRTTEADSPAGSVAGRAPVALPPALEAKLAALEPGLVAVRRDLHRHPELSGEEVRTAGIVADRLRRAGLDVRTGVGGHGVVATLVGGRPGPRVAMRADMDAVTSEAPDPVEFRSAEPGKRHICGHDVHTAVGIGVAEALAAMRDDLPGTVVFLFQPAEERATGARAMLADGAFRDGVPRAIFAFHTAPLEVGTIGSKPGVLLAGRDGITITIESRDAAARKAGGERVERLVRALDTIGPDQVFVPQRAPFRFGQGTRVRDDEAAGVWRLETRLAVSSDSLRDEARRSLQPRTLAKEGVPLTLVYQTREIAGLDNDPALEARSREVIRAVLGDAGLVPVSTVVPAFSEDFGSFQEQAPGVMFWLGVANAKKGIGGMPHSPDYVADEGAILVGARVMSALLLDALEPR
jgi:metal-dependent amidase/aminoacylase/carboxypeptidase family protein